MTSRFPKTLSSDMLKLEVVSTGSEANSYILKSPTGSLILDAGVSAKKLLPRLGDISKACGCLVTHYHGDHSAGAVDLSKRGIDVYMTRGEKEMLKGDTFMIRECTVGKSFRCGDYTILPFDVVHDTPNPVGYLIRYNPTGEKLLYATDTCCMPNTYPKVDHWIIECNYTEDILERQVVDGTINTAMWARLKKSHMSLEKLKECLRTNDMTKTRNIVLVHMSSSRSDEALMVDEIKACTGIRTVAARNKEEYFLG